MNPLLQALSSGYTKEQILKHITRAFPDLAKKITKATAAGYSIDKIFNLMAKTSQPEQTGRMYQSQRHAKMTEEQREIGKSIAKAGLGIAGTAIAGRAVPAMLQNVGTKLGFLGTPSPMQQTPGQQIGQNIQQGQVPGQQTQIPPQVSQQPITQEQINTAPEYQPEFDFLKKRNLVPKIQSMVKSGKSKEQIIEMLKKKMPMMEQEALRSLGPGGREVDLDTKLGNIVDKFFSPNEKLPEPNKSVEKPVEIGSEVITPDGDIANIEVLPGNTAKVDIDGKKHVFETKTLTPVPENKEEILQIYDKLIGAIPEEARSTMISAIGYDAQRNKVHVKFHDGTSYNYDDLDQEDIDSILNLEHLAKTTGGNYFGVHFEGEPSLGAGISKLIQRLQKKYGGKGKEYSGKFKELYSLYAIPEGLRREREKKEREERKRAKRNA